MRWLHVSAGRLGIRMDGDDKIYVTHTLSWVAYVRPFVVATTVALGGLLATVALENDLAAVGIEKQWISIPVGSLAVVWLVYRVLYLRSFKLYTNDSGVWLYHGVFPWQKGTIGVAWRDVDSALYFKSFVSWLCRSYTVTVSHRYTKVVELAMQHVSNGNQFVAHINQELESRYEFFSKAPP